MENNPEYFIEIVYLRAIAILAVISIHVSGFFTKMSFVNFLTLLYMSIDTLSLFAVPLFVCISGFVLYNKYQGSYSLKVFYKKRFFSVIPQYTLFFLFAVFIRYILNIYTGKAGAFAHYSISDFILLYLSGGVFYHMWFFIVIIQLYILYPLIEKVFITSVEKHKILILLIFLLIIQIFYHIFSIKDIFLIGKTTIFLAYIFYFVLGMYVRIHYFDYKKRVMDFKFSYNFYLFLLFGTILGIGNYIIIFFGNDLIPTIIQISTWISAIAAPFYYILIFILCLYIALKISEMIPNIVISGLKLIGNYSFGIYLIHAFILSALEIVLFNKLGFNENNWLFYPLVFILVLSLSLVFVLAMNKVPYHHYIIGNSR